MQNLVFTQLSVPEVRQLLREEIEAVLTAKQFTQPIEDTDEIGGVYLASQITGLAVPTIYSKISELPHFKRGKKLYFSKKALLNWIQEGKRKTSAELAAEASTFQSKNQKAAKAA